MAHFREGASSWPGHEIPPSPVHPQLHCSVLKSPPLSPFLSQYCRIYSWPSHCIHVSCMLLVLASVST